jgi:hypothetical protein
MLLSSRLNNSAKLKPPRPKVQSKSNQKIKKIVIKKNKTAEKRRGRSKDKNSRSKSGDRMSIYSQESSEEDSKILKSNLSLKSKPRKPRFHY